MAYSLWTDKTWSDTRWDISETMAKWGVKEWAIECAVPPARTMNQNLSLEDREVILSFVRRGQTIRLPMNTQTRPVDNLRVLYLAVEAMRMNEKRGIGEVLQNAYLQLAAPEGPRKRDPFVVLGVRPDAPLEVIEASYRAQAKRLHPDVAKDDGAAFRELNEAWEEIKQR